MARFPRSALALVGVVLLAVLFTWGQRFGADRQPADTLPTGTISAAPSPGSPADPSSGSSASGFVIDYADLPEEAYAVISAIRAGGPYDYDRDGTTFGNREGLLPPRPRGYYREYTVRTPGESDRGARRIVGAQDGTLYWTADHYASFREIVGAP